MDEDKPPSPIRKFIADRILRCPHNRGITRRREMAFIQHLSSPMLSSRLRNDLVILETI